MKPSSLLIISLIGLRLQAQPLAPLQPREPQPPGKHFQPGRILLLDSTMQKGYIRSYIHDNASIVFADSTHYVCLKDDFFEIIQTNTHHWLLKKSSDAKPIGTQSYINYYFLYDLTTNNLQLIKTKDKDQILSTAFSKQQ
ncbi:MAG TPA: hypothetical protein VI233_06785 [Puia sp.]